MRLLAVLTLALVPVLAGCSHEEWSRLVSFGGPGQNLAQAPADEPARVARAAPAPATGPAAAPPSTFCLAVARQDAMGNGFDTATQQKVALRSYQQCVATFGNNPGK